MNQYQQQLNVLTDPELRAQLARLPNLEAILGWAPDLTRVDSIQQDEYNYDFLVPWEQKWLAFGIS